ncbi:RNA polymerase subunit sigma [Pigmentiphaga sp. NML030171]|nr:RNA polymerase subunit sigma [Pigmentiphaga sp. NML030171]
MGRPSHGPGRFVVAHYYRELLNFCARAVNNRDAAADIVQECYARFLAIQRRQPIAEPRALLYQTARHIMVDQHRRELVRGHESIDLLAEAEHPAIPSQSQPDAILSSTQRVRAYVSAIEALPPRCREAFVLHVFDGLSHTQIAQRMNTSVSMVEKHVARGRLACRACEKRLQGQDAPQAGADVPGVRIP